METLLPLNLPTQAYAAVSAGAAVERGASRAELANEHGVVLRLRGRLVGFKLGASLGGIKISLK
jgi:hypothetical protein